MRTRKTLGEKDKEDFEIEIDSRFTLKRRYDYLYKRLYEIRNTFPTDVLELDSWLLFVEDRRLNLLSLLPYLC